MLTKYILTIGGVAHNVPEECLLNWDDISFSLKRTDYSGVVRSFSTEFVFVGEMYDLLLDAYLADGVLAEGSVAVYTINDDHTWTERFSAPLDFSSIDMDKGKFTITAIDNSLAALIKSKKGQKYEFPMTQFALSSVKVQRMSFSNSVKYNMPNTANAAGYVDARIDDSSSAVISTEYVEPADESTGYDGTPINRFFAEIRKSPSPLLRIAVSATVRCWLCPDYHMGISPLDDPDIAQLQFGYWDDGLEIPAFHFWANLFDNDITHKRIYGINREMWIGKINHVNYASLEALKAAAASHAYGLYPGMFGVVGNAAYPNATYWSDNEVYEYQGEGVWTAKGMPGMYYQDRQVSGTAAIQGLVTTQYPMLRLNYAMEIMGGTMTMTWADPARTSYAYSAIRPLHLLQAIVSSISPDATASIAEDADGLLENTYFFPAEGLRRMADAKVYSTFQQFADWMSAVFGYTYRIVGNEVQFVHRSAVFDTETVKVIESVRDVKYSVNDSLVYTEVDAGYSKKEYGEIDGRLEKNFTNYYSTLFNITDNKLSLISKYRADSFGIEFTLRKGEKESETKDDKNDEDVFFAFAEDLGDGLKYETSRNAAYSPAVCVENNAGFIAVMGNGKAVTLSMTSSDGNNELSNITIPEGAALFTLGELDFYTDDMDEAIDLDGLIQVDYEGYRYTGFIKEAKARYGRVNGTDYTLIVKTMTTI